MEALEVLKEAWSYLQKARSLWALGLISAAAAVALGFVGIALFAVAALPLTVVILEQNQEALAGLGDTGVAELYEVLDSALVAVGGNLGWLYLWLALGVSVWFALALLDVAAIGGLVTQVNAVAEGQPAGFRLGMADGLRLWWRTAALWALSALPATLYALVVSALMWFVIALPIRRGEVPEASSMFSGPGTLLLQPLSLLVSIVSIPLGILVVIALRYGLVDDVTWKEALARTWRLARSELKRVVLIAIAVWGVTFAVSAIDGLFAGIVMIVATAVAFVGVASGWSGGMIAVVIALVVVLLVTSALAQAFVGVYGSAVWTVFWRRASGAGEGRA